jgi:curved DNA-binding protein CbpA
MNNYYQLLGVSRGASPSVVKIAYEGKLKALAASGLDEAQRKAEAKELEKAYVTLSNDAKAKWYDAQLEKQAAAESAAPGRGTVIAVAVVMALFAAGIGWYFVERTHKIEALRVEGERLKAEQVRLLAEREREEREKDLERARLEQQQNPGTRRLEIRVRGDERDQALRERAYNDAQSYREEAQKRTLQTYDRREQQAQEDRYRRQAEEDRRRAQAEVERQKRFVRERELEEERARIARSRR